MRPFVCEVAIGFERPAGWVDVVAEVRIEDGEVFVGDVFREGTTDLIDLEPLEVKAVEDHAWDKWASRATVRA